MGRKDNAISSEKAEELLSGEHLRIARQIKGISLSQLAIKLGYSKGYLSSVENNLLQGARDLIEKYEKALALPAGTLVEKYFAGRNNTKPSTEPVAPPVSPTIYLPHRRDPFFIGRDSLIERLYEVLNNEKVATVVWAISGLGGVGKTDLALEYAYRYLSDYQTTLWLSADSHERLLKDIDAVAHLLNLPEREEKDQSIADVKDWLQQNRRWLLILDGVDDFTVIHELLTMKVKGHILITTRSRVTGRFAPRIDVEPMDLREGMLLLLRRATILELDEPLEAAIAQEQELAQEIVCLMGGLPLALVQAGAYIEATQCGLDGYLARFQNNQTKLLERRGMYLIDHPDSIATVWSRSFESVRQASPTAMNILYLCAFLDPDSIPEEIFTKSAKSAKGTSQLDSPLASIPEDPLLLDEAIAALLKYSLIQRNHNHTLTIHRLVQVMLRNEMDHETQALWAERAVRAISA